MGLCSAKRAKGQLVPSPHCEKQQIRKRKRSKVNACGWPKLAIRHARHAERLRLGSGHDAVDVDLDAVEP